MLAKTNNDAKINAKQMNPKIINGSDVVNQMDESKYLLLMDNLDKKDIKVIQAVDDDLLYLQSIGTETSYGNGYIMHIGEVPSAFGMYEEIIHSTQARIYCEFVDSNQIELCDREVSVNKMLLRNGKAYGFDKIDFEDIERNLSEWEIKFKDLVGVSYGESDNKREISNINGIGCKGGKR